MAYDVVVVGAGILGLATAYKLQLARPGLKVAVVDKEQAVATHQTGHNSGVIHTGIYYKPGSLKAKLCVDGHRQMLEFAAAHAIQVKRMGKLIIASNKKELGRLEELFQRGQANGVEGLERLGREEMKSHEPAVVGEAAIWSPETTIIDYREVAGVLAREITGNGGTLLLDHEVRGLRKSPDGASQILTSRDPIETKHVIVCAGLQSDRIARLFGGKEDGVRIVPFRGKYFHLSKAAAAQVHGLIYPVPDPRFPFLGVHLTTHIDGTVSAGPNAVMTLRREGYHGRGINARDASQVFNFPGFYRLAGRYWRMGAREVWHNLGPANYAQACRRYMPSLKSSDLIPGPSGVRAQAVTRDGRMVDDFLFAETANTLHVRNAPSPGATASLAIADYLVDRARKTFLI